MAYSLASKLVITVASSALFDLTESDGVFCAKGVDAYRQYQRENERNTLGAGVAFPLIKRILQLNAIQPGQKPVEVVLLSRNDPDTGLRVMNSIEEHGLDITRSAFLGGNDPFPYMRAFNSSLFLTAEEEDVRNAIALGLPAGQVYPTEYVDAEGDVGLRIAFDFDGVIADGSSDAVFQKEGVAGFLRIEAKKEGQPCEPGPLGRFFQEVGRLQRMEKDILNRDPDYSRQLTTAIVTSRNAPAHKRVVTTLREWGIEVDQVFFLGGLDKGEILSVFKPHIFFDDQRVNLREIAGLMPCAHVPCVATNPPSEQSVLSAYKEASGGAEPV